MRRSIRRDEGTTFVELVVVTGLILVMSSMSVPLTARAIEAGRARHAAGFVASRLRWARQQAVMGTHGTGLVFNQQGTRWTFQVCIDANKNGLRRAEIASGDDPCVDGPFDLAAMFPGVSVAVDPTLPGPDGTASSADAVRFGASDIASFSPLGTGTAGTLFLRTRTGTQYAIRVANTTGRTRTLRYDTGSHTWVSA